MKNIKDITMMEVFRFMKIVSALLVFFWIVIFIGNHAGLIILTPTSSIIMIFFFWVISMILVNSIYITERNPVYGIVNMILLLVSLYTIVPMVGSMLEDKWGTLFMMDYRIVDVWETYSWIVKLITLSVIVLGYVKVVVTLHNHEEEITKKLQNLKKNIPHLL